MSELQISLLVIGIFVVLVLYGYGGWRQWQYRRKFGAAFKPAQDALFQAPAETMADAFPDQVVQQVLAEEMPSAVSAEPLPARSPDAACDLLDAETDYIAVLSFDTPVGADALAQLWQKRFDFGKSVQVCGLSAATGEWEKIIAESRLYYTAFKLALQLVDRSGAVSEVRLSDFRDLARDLALQLHAQTELPEVAAAAAQAVRLDNSCAAVDQMIGLNILPGGERKLNGADISRVAGQHGMALQPDGAFHLPDDQDQHTVFTLGDLDGTPFQHHTLEQTRVNGLTLLLDVPRVQQPTQRFEEMAKLARQLAMDLHAAVVDDHRVALGEPGIAQIRQQVADIEERMRSGAMVPGSAQARRLFS